LFGFGLKLVLIAPVVALKAKTRLRVRMGLVVVWRTWVNRTGGVSSP
jgi:hypothetical protein